jgi:hypothetical protein
VDWITLIVEAVGIVIFVIWAVLPIGEFREIHRRIKAREAEAAAAAAEQVGAGEVVGERVGRDA